MRRMSIVAAVSTLAAVFSIGASGAGDLDSIFERQRTEFRSTKSSNYCFSGSNIKVVDTSAPINQAFLDKMKDFGVEAIARYYGYTNKKRSPSGRRVSPFQTKKVIAQSEVDLLRENGMASIAVFQYLSQSEETFANWNVRAAADANRALDLAREFGQPEKTTIYFGADGDFVHNLNRPCKKIAKDKAGNCTQEVLNYFSIVSDLVRKKDYDVGVYGSGATCELLTEKGLVKYCWLNFSPGHANRQFGLTSKKTVLRQLVEAKSVQEISRCGRKIDFDQARAKDFGQFHYK